MTLPDVIRKMVMTAIESGKGECTGAVWQIISMSQGLSDEENLSLKVNDLKRAELVKSEKRLTNSYITNTCNRMRILQDEDKSVSIRFGENENGDKLLTIKLKSGRMKIGSRSKTEIELMRKGGKEFAAKLVAIAPDISHLEGDERKLGALEGIRLIKEFIRQEAGI